MTTPRCIASSSAMAPVSRHASSARPVRLVQNSSAMRAAIHRPSARRRRAADGGARFEPEQASRADEQPDAADGARAHRQAGPRVGRVPAERDSGRRWRTQVGGEAQQEAVEREMVEAPAPQGERGRPPRCSLRRGRRRGTAGATRRAAASRERRAPKAAPGDTSRQKRAHAEAERRAPRRRKTGANSPTMQSCAGTPRRSRRPSARATALRCAPTASNRNSARPAPSASATVSAVAP